MPFSHSILLNANVWHNYCCNYGQTTNFAPCQAQLLRQATIQLFQLQLISLQLSNFWNEKLMNQIRPDKHLRFFKASFSSRSFSLFAVIELIIFLTGFGGSTAVDDFTVRLLRSLSGAGVSCVFDIFADRGRIVADADGAAVVVSIFCFFALELVTWLFCGGFLLNNRKVSF